jgi:hypothetical protein
MYIFFRLIWKMNEKEKLFFSLNSPIATNAYRFLRAAIEQLFVFGYYKTKFRVQ